MQITTLFTISDENSSPDVFYFNYEVLRRDFTSQQNFGSLSTALCDCINNSGSGLNNSEQDSSVPVIQIGLRNSLKATSVVLDGVTAVESSVINQESETCVHESLAKKCDFACHNLGTKGVSFVIESEDAWLKRTTWGNNWCEECLDFCLTHDTYDGFFRACDEQNVNNFYTQSESGSDIVLESSGSSQVLPASLREIISFLDKADEIHSQESICPPTPEDYAEESEESFVDDSLDLSRTTDFVPVNAVETVLLSHVSASMQPQETSLMSENSESAMHASLDACSFTGSIVSSGQKICSDENLAEARHDSHRLAQRTGTKRSFWRRVFCCGSQRN